jgi:hypothetical protein
MWTGHIYWRANHKVRTLILRYSQAYTEPPALVFIVIVRIYSISIDPNTGGCTRVEGGHPPTVLAAGTSSFTSFEPSFSYIMF